METDNNKRKRLLERLLTDLLSPDERQKILERESVETEMKKQWKEFADDPIGNKTKKLIWRKIQRKCDDESATLVHIELW